MKWLANQLMQASHRTGLGLDVTRYNPRPAGVFRAGSATETVLAFLRACRERSPKEWQATYQIQQATDKSGPAVWAALTYLIGQGLVEATADASRNPRYRRYRATEKQDGLGLSRRELVDGKR